MAKRKYNAWIYLWPDEKKIQQGHLVWKRIKESTQKNHFLKELPVEIIIKSNRAK